ncbi:MAG: hypothetical protein RO469_03825 [Thermincola sp.]|nr:hypothetical protein [Thermincola sp.]MDT3702026.1 hypothetical protein [Thermincola sp.]
MRTHRLISLLLTAFLTGNLAGCADQAAYQTPPSPPPHIEGYDDRYWVWDEDDGEWEYDPPGGGAPLFFYGGRLHKTSIRSTPGYQSFSNKSSSSSKLGGFGSGTRGGGFGG